MSRNPQSSLSAILVGSSPLRHTDLIRAHSLTSGSAPLCTRSALAARVGRKAPADHGADDGDGARAVRVLGLQVGRLFVAGSLVGAVAAAEPADAGKRLRGGEGGG